MRGFKKKLVAKILKLVKGRTAYKVRKNFEPDAQELMNRLAVHVLFGAATDTHVILAFDKERDVYLEAFIPPAQDDDEAGDGTVTPRPLGTVEYMVCDGLPGDRSHGLSFYTLAEALAEFREIADLGWDGYRQKYTPSTA